MTHAVTRSWNRRRLLAVAGILAATVTTPRVGLAAAAIPSTSCFAVKTYPVGQGDGPHDVAPAPDGRIWYTAQRAGALGLFDPRIDQVERIPLGSGSAPHGVIVGPDGAAWVTDGGLNAILRVDPATKQIHTYPVPGDNADLNTAVFDRDGILWFTGQAGILGRLDPRPGHDRVATIAAPRGAGPYGITVTPDDTVYFASLAGSYLGRIVAGGAGFRAEVIEPPTPHQGARRVWSDAGGNLWVSEWFAGNVARYAPATKVWREWRLPGGQPQPYAVYVDDGGAVWLSDFGINALVRFAPATETFSSLPLPDAGGAVRQLNGRAGEVWGAESAADKLIVVGRQC